LGYQPNRNDKSCYAVTPATVNPLFLVVGIEFFQEVNGQMYPLKNGAFNPLAIIKAEG
jgi:hypothetical protein